MLKKYYLGGFFWVPIPIKQYQNMSGFTSDCLSGRGMAQFRKKGGIGKRGYDLKSGDNTPFRTMVTKEHIKEKSASSRCHMYNLLVPRLQNLKN